MLKNVRLNLLRNRRGGMNLAYEGYLYSIERRYKTTTNWTCNKIGNPLRCPARCVTTNDSIKLSIKPHNHDPVY